MSDHLENFDGWFKELTGHPPFPWQRSLFAKLMSGETPSHCNLPTGLGKTSVVAIWLLAHLLEPTKTARRLVYVVNRRTVVDQTTNEVTKLRDNFPKLPENVRRGLEGFAISTLRGQFADNREWSTDPSKPAVICGTVDMIGSRLLFSGYGVGFKGKPLHAGFLGQDALLVHDEAHLEEPFDCLVRSIVKEQTEVEPKRRRMDDGGIQPAWPHLKIMSLTATNRNTSEKPFELSDEDYKNPFVAKRLNSTKKLHLHAIEDEKKISEQIVSKAIDFKDKNRAVLIFVRKVEDVEKIIGKLPKGRYEQLTGTMRGRERDELVRKKIFRRFLPDESVAETDDDSQDENRATVYLVCTSAGEVGVNISADDLICDLSTFESMAQRFGRVNRFGEQDDSQVHIFYPTLFPEKDKLSPAREKTLHLLNQLEGQEVSPIALGKLDPELRAQAFAPLPEILPATDILFDAWAMTTIREPLPGRPPVDEYLHGVEDKEVAETHFAWREEVSLISEYLRTGVIQDDDIEELLEHCDVESHEMLRVPTYGRGKAYDQIQEIARRAPDSPIWIIEPNGDLITNKTVSDVVEKRGNDYATRLAGRTLLLPPEAGGLTSKGTLLGEEAFLPEVLYDVHGSSKELPLLRFIHGKDADGYDVLKPVAGVAESTTILAPILLEGSSPLAALNKRLREAKLPRVRLKFSLKLPPVEEDESIAREYLVFQPTRPVTQKDSAAEWPLLESHLQGVRDIAVRICRDLRLVPELARAIELAAAWHDLGKSREIWQRGAGNSRSYAHVAKPIHGRPPENLNRYRHELGSMIDVCSTTAHATEFDRLSEEQQEIVMHLIAAHHGRARPHFPSAETNDPESPAAICEQIVSQVPCRYARFQRRFGRWGLAYLESILRAADAIDSKRIEEAPLSDPVMCEWPMPTVKALRSAQKPMPKPSIRIKVDVTNPGQFFACCGLLELADRLWPGAEGWFEPQAYCIYANDPSRSLSQLIGEARSTFFGVGDEDEPEEDDTENKESRVEPFCLFWKDNTSAIRLDWWSEKSIKPWAGSMKERVILRAMLDAIDPSTADLFDDLKPVFYKSPKKKKPSKKEPFYFDPRRGNKSHPRDSGFSPDAHKMQSECCPALEALCFVGLQRARPARDGIANQSRYSVWSGAIPIAIVGAVTCGIVPVVGAISYRFNNYFRTDKRQHKAFSQATLERKQ